MRYPTVGDYYYKEDGTLKFEIADMGNPVYNRLVLIHEMIEQMLTEYKGIPEEEISKFDLEYEANRPEDDIESEPGFAPGCPYMEEHTIATAVEMLLVGKMGLSWEEYNKTVMEL